MGDQWGIIGERGGWSVEVVGRMGAHTKFKSEEPQNQSILVFALFFRNFRLLMLPFSFSPFRGGPVAATEAILQETPIYHRFLPHTPLYHFLPQHPFF